ncbi:MAG: glycoside hydrolase family 92 protein [Ruminococcaceae bacterium]|nr:glycoside hydrolase family 92 protein [Oscillospiraceae bacterium]
MKYCNYVNTKQGSKSVHRYSNGNTLPLVQLPFGMTAFAPQTVEGNIRWYYHPDSRSFEGLRLTHQPSPWIADYGSMIFMPQNKLLGGFDGEDRWSGFRPEDAVLTPYYLKYRLLRSKCDLEVTPTERCAVIKVSFDEDGDNYFSVLPVKGMCSYRFDKKTNTLYASTDMHMSGEAVKFKNYVVLKFPEGSVNAEKTLISNDDKFRNGTKCRGKKAGIHIYLNEKVTEIKLASSYISFGQAILNLEAELSGKSFKDVKTFAEDIWESCLSRVRIETKDKKLLKTFYSCMYRAFLYPHKCHEYDKNGNAIHYCPHDGSIKNGVRYTDNGFWDTYRTVYPFFALVAKDELREMLVAFINEYKESGWLPRWLSIGECGCMPSTLIDAVICDGAVKGFIDNDLLEVALEGMIKHSVTNAPARRFGRNGAEEYCKLGYVSYETEKESVNLTLDAAYGDWCIAEIAKILGKSDIEKEYRKRALNYKKLFDPESGFMRAKDKKGNFRPGFVPEGWGRDYTEGSAWQNSFAVPHDIEGLAELYGGKDKLIAKIDELFATPPHYDIIGYGCEIHEITEMAAVDFGQCGMNNQPSFHIPYIYSALGEVEKSAYWVKEICDKLFSYEDDGFPGDEDNGTTAIWYIFGILGLYPFCPGKPEYVKGIKQVDKAFIGDKELDVNKFDGNKIQYKDLI